MRGTMFIPNCPTFEDFKLLQAAVQKCQYIVKTIHTKDGVYLFFEDETEFLRRMTVMEKAKLIALQEQDNPSRRIR